VRWRWPALTTAGALGALAVPAEVASVALIGGAIALGSWLVWYAGFVASMGRRWRVTHGLEHATAAVLEQRGIPVPFGRAERSGFLLDVFDASCDVELVGCAAETAIARVQGGETALICDRMCGSFRDVRVAVVSLVVCAVGAAHLALAAPPPPGIALVAALALASLLADASRPLGMLFQRRVMVSARFVEAVVLSVTEEPHRGLRRFTVALRVRCHGP
jgi:hypothetical protein